MRDDESTVARIPGLAKPGTGARHHRFPRIMSRASSARLRVAQRIPKFQVVIEGNGSGVENGAPATDPTCLLRQNHTQPENQELQAANIHFATVLPRLGRDHEGVEAEAHRTCVSSTGQHVADTTLRSLHRCALERRDLPAGWCGRLWS
ncbi:hypothetical protein [Bradyrhizobium oligotrophicum]|uniref:hypothetical protein n=1 Tax=Bradyrhizobium oligotrophicum TaxID=44255 RepID=UPI0013923A05|nr:hypothetical protein [Bradyrhizobium oligotrophicum]